MGKLVDGRPPGRTSLLIASLALSVAIAAVLLGAVAFAGFLGCEMRRCAETSVRRGSSVSSRIDGGAGLAAVGDMRACSR